MITANFFRHAQDNKLLGFAIYGHADFADMGSDVACASVTSAVMLTANTITDVFKLNAAVNVEENAVLLKLNEDENGEGDKLLLGLLSHLYLMKEEFPDALSIKIVDKN